MAAVKCIIDLTNCVWKTIKKIARPLCRLMLIFEIMQLKIKKLMFIEKIMLHSN